MTRGVDHHASVLEARVVRDVGHFIDGILQQMCIEQIIEGK